MIFNNSVIEAAVHIVQKKSIYARSRKQICFKKD